MSFKDEAILAIDALPKKATVDDIINAVYLVSKFDHGETQIKNGKGISHTRAVKRLSKWLK
ncbi:MAG: hypothetical protein JNL74_15095 [Fibrobacteres bacterium]|nr:hypothetical protein [Fibrobacterota bacterium]